MKQITDTILYVGVDDHDIDLFERQYRVPNGMAYNSYVILDDKTVVMDTIDENKTEEWLGKVEEALQGRQPDYLVIQHMEPDHSASMASFLEKYPHATVVGNARTFMMIKQFFPELVLEHTLTVKDGETISLGEHTLHFTFAPMVHWPEVMMTYEEKEKVFFSADGFGKFGALDAEEDWAEEAARYYFGIVGKYGMQVQNVLRKAAALDIQIICPLHGPMLTENLGYYLNLYQTWSGYQPESKGVCICYASIYGHTKAAALLLAKKLAEAGVETVCHDLTDCEMSKAVRDAFRYDRLVLAAITYNASTLPAMKTFIDLLSERGYQNRTIGVMENGSWAPMAGKVMREAVQKMKGITLAEHSVTITSALNGKSRAEVEALAKELASVQE